MKSYDYILIGTGQATGTILSELLERGLNIAVVESDRVGGSCVNWGCTPTKALVASARAAHMARRGKDFGISTGELSVDFKAVMKRVNDMRFPASDGFRSWLEKTVDFYPGTAHFVDEHTVSIEGTKIRGEHIILHTGTRARKPDIPGIDSIHWLDNKGILDLWTLPEHLLVVGGSYVGLEFAQAFRRLGSSVTLFERSDRLITREDADIGEAAKEILSGEGITFEFNTQVTKLAASHTYQDGVTIHYQQDGKEKSLEGSHLLLAVGRVPNTDALDLDAAGVEMNDRGFINVDDVGRTSIPHIYALGDVNGRGAFTHTSVHDGQVFNDHLAGGTKKISDRIPIYAMYIDPPLARVGMSQT
ncbi:MAG: FAD-dependent oxidoreductase, partial [Spirochaetota bacterium]